jgi:zinc protease
LSDGVYTLEVHPFPKLAAAPVDSSVRKQLPKAGDPPKATFPALQRATLSNGVKVILAEVPSIPMVNLSMRFDAGYAADQFAAPGTASMTLNMMDEGTKKRSALQISEDLALLGAGLGTGSDLDMSAVTLSTLTSNLDAAMEIWADVILDPSFPNEELERQQKQTLAQIQREKATPIQMALRVFPQMLYGSGHAYSVPFTGSGTEVAVAALKRDDLVKFHGTWIRPNNATLVVVGKTTLAEIQPKLEKLFKGWKPGTLPTKNVANVGMTKQTVFIMDKPGALQSVILAGHIAPPQNNPNEVAIDMMNTALGGSFTARINMNLRENKHWSYGAQSLLFGARGQRPFLVYAPVQTDKTKESMQEISKELSDVLSSRPVNEDEWKKVRDSKILELPGSWETMNAIAGSINEIVRFGYAETYFQTYADRVRGASLAQLNEAAQQVVKPSSVVWIVVGDRAKIEKGVRELGYGDVRFIDGDGKIVE